MCTFSELPSFIGTLAATVLMRKVFPIYIPDTLDLCVYISERREDSSPILDMGRSQGE